MLLADYLASIQKRRWQIGQLDCSTFMADWIVAKGLPDPIADVRGSYHTERQYQRILIGHGSFVDACEARLTAVGMTETDAPRVGDVAAIQCSAAKQDGRIQTLPTGAIVVSSDRVAIVTSDLGLLIAPTARLPIIKAWTS